MMCTWEIVRQILQSEMQEKFMKAANHAQQARGDIDKMPWLPWLCVLYAHGPTSLCMCEAGTESQHDHLILIAVVQSGMRFFGERSYCPRTRAKDKCNLFSCGDSRCHSVVNP